MRRALALLLLSYAALVALFALGGAALPVLRAPLPALQGRVTVGDAAIIALTLAYGLLVYAAGRLVLRGSCRGSGSAGGA
ncbi:MAG: hypothetical protein LM577_01995 [Thermoproteaceae archaeon]|jgi:polyferredoxin|nr:hypothetical protein [Thermoproteaceae archaeon]